MAPCGPSVGTLISLGRAVRPNGGTRSITYVVVLLTVVVWLALSVGASMGAMVVVHTIFPTEERTVYVDEECYEVDIRREECVPLEEPKVVTERRSLGGGDIYIGIAAFVVTAGGLFALANRLIMGPTSRDPPRKT